MSANTTTTSTSPTTTSPVTTCPPIPDYLTLRKQNLEQIQNYYNQLLKDYSGYAGNNMASAQNMLADYHNQFNAAAESLLNNLNTTLELVSEQHSTIQENSDLVTQNRNRLAQLKRDIKRLMAENDARHQNAIDTKKSTKYTGYWHKGFLALNIILLLVAIGLVIWIFLSSSSGNGRNTRATNNTARNNGNKPAANYSSNLI